MKKTSIYFEYMTKELYDTMMFRTGTPLFSIFLWIYFPCTLMVLLGWYVADIMSEDEEK
jgi:hypothetical protein